MNRRLTDARYASPTLRAAAAAAGSASAAAAVAVLDTACNRCSRPQAPGVGDSRPLSRRAVLCRTCALHQTRARYHQRSRSEAFRLLRAAKRTEWRMGVPTPALDLSAEMVAAMLAEATGVMAAAAPVPSTTQPDVTQDGDGGLDFGLGAAPSRGEHERGEDEDTSFGPQQDADRTAQAAGPDDTDDGASHGSAWRLVRRHLHLPLDAENCLLLPKLKARKHLAPLYQWNRAPRAGSCLPNE